MLRRVGRYELSSPLGEGGSGQVYRARDPVLRREVAVKLFVGLEELTAEEQAMARGRFAREARAAAAVRHPNVVEVYDAGEERGVPFLVMELVEGSTLAKLVGRPLSFSHRAKIALDIAHGLEALHAVGFVHRDVKPSNVLVDDKTMTAKVADLGLIRDDGANAAAMTSSFATVTGSILGTPRYMAPEQLAGLRADQRTDQFGWGLIAVELFTGKPREVGRLGPAYAAELAAIPGRLSAIVERATRENMTQRFPTTRELVLALEQVVAEIEGDSRRDTVESSPTATVPGAPLGPVRSSSSLALIAIVLVAVTALLVAGCVGLFLYLKSRDDSSLLPLVASPPVPPASDGGAARDADAEEADTKPLEVVAVDAGVAKLASTATPKPVIRPTTASDPRACACLADVSPARNRGVARAVCVLPKPPRCLCYERFSAKALCRMAASECTEEQRVWPASAGGAACRGYLQRAGITVLVEGTVKCDSCWGDAYYAGAQDEQPCRGTWRDGEILDGRWSCRHP